MIIYKSLQIFRSIIMIIKIHKNDHYAMMLIFQKNADVRRERGLTRKGGKNRQKIVDVFYCLWMAPHGFTKK